MGKSQSVGSIERALEILFLMYDQNRELGVTEIANILDVSKSTAHRTLVALKKRNFVEQKAETGTYWLGSMLFSMGMLYSRKFSLRKICSPYLKKLANMFNETVNLGVLDKNDLGHVLIIDQINTDQRLTIVPSIGVRNQAHCSSIGKVLLSYTNGEYLKYYETAEFEVFTSNTITDLDQLKRELKEVREKGYAIDKEESEIGLMCVGAPIFNQEEAIAALSIAGPSQRFSGERIIQIVEGVKQIANEISEKLNS